jgi:hypothetical protein
MSSVAFTHLVSWFLVPLGVFYLMMTVGVRTKALEWRRRRRCPTCGRDDSRCRCRYQP